MQNTYSGMSSYPVWEIFFREAIEGKGRLRERDCGCRPQTLGQRSLKSPISVLYQHNYALTFFLILLQFFSLTWLLDFQLYLQTTKKII